MTWKQCVNPFVINGLRHLTSFHSCIDQDCINLKIDVYFFFKNVFFFFFFLFLFFLTGIC